MDTGVRCTQRGVRHHVSTAMCHVSGEGCNVSAVAASPYEISCQTGRGAEVAMTGVRFPVRGVKRHYSMARDGNSGKCWTFG